MPEIRVGVPALDMKAYLDDLVRLATRKEPTLFSMKAKVPTQGRADLILAATDHMSIILKAYASGGENALHAHTNEDHAFFVLQGEATFYGESNSRLATLKKLEGILVPRGALYRFEAGVAEPLVMLRVGTAELNPNPAAAFARVNDHGHDMDAYSEDNKEVELRYDREIWFPAKTT